MSARYTRQYFEVAGLTLSTWLVTTTKDSLTAPTPQRRKSEQMDTAI